MSEDYSPHLRKAGDILFREGDPGDCAYVIEEGRVRISVDRDGGQVVLGEVGAGEIIGEMAIIDQRSRTATATVVRDCRLIRVTPHQIQQRIDASDPVVRSLMRILLKRYRSELFREQGLPAETESSLLSHYGGIQKIRFENELMQAIENGDIELVYQPFRRLEDDSIRGFEALVRWEHPGRGTIPSRELVALAEETDLIGPLELYVFESAAADIGAFQDAAPEGLSISINVSPKHTLDREFLRQVLEICNRTGTAPRVVMLELTESVQVDIGELSNWVGSAKHAGFEITVDDFGTGYASLEYLTRLDPDIVKIDQNFVGPIVSDPRSIAVLRRVMQMASDLGVQVIAEGAETAEHVRLLADLGCDMAQGYAVGRPITRSQVPALFARP